MKTILDLENMKEQPYLPFENAYEGLLTTLADDYIGKSNGLERIKAELDDWDKEAQTSIVNSLVDRISQSGLEDFDQDELCDLVE